MPKKKEDQIEETGTEATETAAEETPKRSRKAAAAEIQEPSIVDSVVEAAADAMVSVAETIGTVAADVVSAVTAPSSPAKPKTHKRSERVGIVSSDKMTKTVTVRVDRLVKHPVYRKYVKKRKKFMAHDDLGAKIGDKVKIVETRPMSARKRWRVVEIIQRAEL
jgi:small subunit ribosomal protein S17